MAEQPYPETPVVAHAAKAAALMIAWSLLKIGGVLTALARRLANWAMSDG